MTGLQYEHSAKYRKSFRIKGTLSIDASCEKLWQIISAPGHLEKFHPFVKEHTAPENWGRIGGKDQGIFNNGKKINRVIIDWEEGRGYKIEMENNDGNNTSVSFNLRELSSETTNFSVEIQTNAYRKIPRPFWTVFTRYSLIPSYKKYLYSFLKGLAHYAKTGKQVKKNQFGNHQKFSP